MKFLAWFMLTLVALIFGGLPASAQMISTNQLDVFSGTVSYWFGNGATAGLAILAILAGLGALMAGIRVYRKR